MNKSRLLRLVSFAALGVAPLLRADTLAADTAVFLQPDPASPVITRLTAGTAAPATIGEAPAGWRRVEVTGEFTAYARSRDITKALDVRPGGNIHTAPSSTAPVLTVALEAEHTDVIGLAGGDWCQVRVHKPLQGFVALGAAANLPAEAPKPAALSIASVPVASTQAAPVEGHAVATTSTADLPRLLAGTLASAKHLLNFNPPYPLHLTDSSGRRLAFVDTTRLRLDGRLDDYLNRQVLITGTVRNTSDGRDLVIAAELIELKK